MPILGLGMFALSDSQAENSTYWALKAGFRLIDTARIYGNEAAVGRGLQKAIEEGIVTRDEVFITTKMWTSDFDNGDAAVDASLEALGVDYIDLMILHHSQPSRDFTYSGYDVETMIVNALEKDSVEAFAQRAAELGEVKYFIDTAGASPNQTSPEHILKLDMVGTGYAVREIRNKISTLGLQDRVTLLGNIHDRERLKKIDAAADLFLFPSLYDNAPLVVREAAALHTPALMLQESTAAEVINPGVNGFLTPNDVKAYADQISYLMEHPEILVRVGNKASKTISRSWENVIEEVLLRYRDIQESYKLKHGIIV